MKVSTDPVWDHEEIQNIFDFGWIFTNLIIFDKIDVNIKFLEDFVLVFKQYFNDNVLDILFFKYCQKELGSV